MKKILLMACVATVLTSCYSTKIYMGDVGKKEPVVKVQSVKNHHIICGLVPVGKNNIKPSEYMGDKANYMVKTNLSFVDLLISALTAGIYTPTTTTFYAPLKYVEK